MNCARRSWRSARWSSIFFRGVGPGGYDIYGAKFENGTAEFRLLIEPDGKAGDVIFRPDGNDELGGIVLLLGGGERARPRRHFADQDHGL